MDRKSLMGSRIANEQSDSDLHLIVPFQDRINLDFEFNFASLFVAIDVVFGIRRKCCSFLKSCSHMKKLYLGMAATSPI